MLLKELLFKNTRDSPKCANDYWLRFCGDIQTATDSGNTRAMCEGMKKDFGSSVIKTAPLKCT